MGKKWDWKTATISFIIGIFIGRLTKSSARFSTSQIGQNASVQLPIVRKEVEKVIVEAVLLLCGVGKELMKDLGFELKSTKEIKEASNFTDLDETVDQAMKNAEANAEKAGYTLSEEDKKKLSSWAGPFFDHLTSLMAKIFISFVPTVPIDVSPGVYEATDMVIKSVLAKMKDRDPDMFKNMENKLPEMEKVRSKWIHESRPETYTKTLLQIINCVNTPPSTDNIYDIYISFYDSAIIKSL